MLTPDGLLSWFQRLSTPEPTRTTIDQVRSCGPSRRVGGGRSNVSGRYPSKKMGVTIQFESHWVELAGIYEMEHDVGVLEFFDQPPPIKLEYESATGKRMGVLHTPDFFVIRETEAGWEEWKTEEDLQRLSERNPNRYCAGEGGHWCCPPGTVHAGQLGLYCRVRSSAEIDRVFQRNIRFLEDYFRGSHEIVPARREAAVARVSAAPGLMLEDLLRLTGDAIPADDIFALIAADVLYVDLCAAPLAEPAIVKVFPSREAASRAGSGGQNTPFAAGGLRCGSQMTWDGRIWDVVNLGETAVSLISRWRKRGAVRISEKVDIQKLLQESLAQDQPVSPHHLAARLGYANEGYLQRRFPDLCRAIRQKIAAHKVGRLAEVERVLTEALKEEPVPTLGELRKRLGYSSSECLQLHFPGLCEQILASRQVAREQMIADFKRTLQGLLSETPAVSLRVAADRI